MFYRRTMPMATGVLHLWLRLRVYPGYSYGHATGLLQASGGSAAIAKGKSDD